MRKYPIGIQTFAKIREEGYAYVDKTEYVGRLVKAQGYYFLARPRRFGKSLLLSTIESYFKGRRDLFRGLAIDAMDLPWETAPVIHIDLNSKNYKDEKSLTDLLSFYLSPYETEFAVEPGDADVDERFFKVLMAAYKATGKKVVVLVDEYDKPLLSSIGNEELQEKYRAILKGFYGVLKSADRFVQFGMLTGVTRFGKISVFSDLNNMRDISLETEYDAICGVTEEELHSCFGDGVSQLAASTAKTVEDTYGELKYNYDGYHFSENLRDIYNPYSLINALAKGKISNYWFETGTPTFLYTLLQNENYDLSKLEGDIEYDPTQLTGVMVSDHDAVPMLYQSGYLTIKRIDEFFGTVFLGYPNHEVEDSFLKGLLPVYSRSTSGAALEFINNFVRDALSGRIDSFMTSLQSMLARIPVHSNDQRVLELHYHNMMYLISQLVGLKVHTEYQTCNGRIDLVIETPKYVYVMEFKIGETAEDAMRQIEERQYGLPFKADKRNVYMIGASFSNATRTLSDWTVTKPV